MSSRDANPETDRDPAISSDERGRLYQQLDELYLNPRNPMAFSSFSKFFNSVKDIEGVTKSLVKEYLLEQDSYTRYGKPKKFRRRPIVAFEMDSIWQVNTWSFEQSYITAL